MQPYLLLCVAAAWHAMAIGTIGLRGRIVAVILAVGFGWGALTPPWGWVQIGAAVATICTVRWAAGEKGRPVVWWALCQLGAMIVRAPGVLARVLWDAVAAVLPSPTHEAPAVERDEPVSPRGETVYATPSMMRWSGPVTSGSSHADTAADGMLTPQDIIGEVMAGTRGYNDAAKYFQKVFGLSRSTFARYIRTYRQEKAA